MARARSLTEFQSAFPDEASCAAFLFERRWPDGFVCPACGAARAAALKSRAYTYEWANVKPGATLLTDGHSSYPGLTDYRHDPRAVGKMAGHVVLPWIHRVFSLMKRWGLGTYHGLRRKHVDTYLNEFVFRYNRRFYRHASFETVLGLTARHAPSSYWDIVGRPNPKGRGDAQARAAPQKDSGRNASGRRGRRPNRGPESRRDDGVATKHGRTWDNAISHRRSELKRYLDTGRPAVFRKSA
jgi:transposase-like protein